MNELMNELNETVQVQKRGQKETFVSEVNPLFLLTHAIAGFISSVGNK